MNTNRLIAGGVAVALVAGLVGLAVVAGRGGDGQPAVLPVLGAGGDHAPEAMADSSDMRVGGRIEYRASGELPSLDGEAEAWHVPAGQATADRVTRLAETLGVEGEVGRSEFGWTVGTDARRLDVQDVAGDPWSLYESHATATITREEPVEAEARRTDALEGAGSSRSSGATSTDTMVAPAPDCAADACDEPQFHEPERPADLPSEEEAARLGRQLLAELGIDLDRAVVRVDDAVTLWNVSADPEVGGLPTIGLATSVGIGPNGAVRYGNGWLGELSKGDRYPLIGTAAALEKLGDEQASVLMIDPAPGEGAVGEELEPMIVEITGVRLGLQLFSTYEPGADAYLVPSYLFTIADGGDLPVIAVDDEFLGPVQHHDDVPGTPAEPEPGREPFPGEETCAGAGEATPDGDGIEATVCASTGRVGEPVVVRVTAAGRMRDDCGSPVVDFGDAEGTPVCGIGCESLPPEPVELERTFEHTYAQPGAYDVVVQFRGCGEDSGTDQLRVPILVRVEG